MGDAWSVAFLFLGIPRAYRQVCSQRSDVMLYFDNEPEWGMRERILVTILVTRIVSGGGR